MLEYMFDFGFLVRVALTGAAATKIADDIYVMSVFERPRLSDAGCIVEVVSIIITAMSIVMLLFLLAAHLA